MMLFCSLQLSSDAAVKRVLAGERADAKEKPPTSKSREKESRESKSEERKSHKDKEVGFGKCCGGQRLPLFVAFWVFRLWFGCVK